MTLDPSQIEDIKPVSGITVTEGGLAGAAEVLKPVPGLSAGMAPMLPEAAAGVDLAKFVLKIVSGSIAVLVLYLLVTDIIGSNQASDVHSQVLKQAGIGAEYSDPDSIDKVRSIIQRGIDDKDATVNEVDKQLGISLQNGVLQSKMLSNNQNLVLGKCFPYPTTAERNDILTACLDLLQIEERVARSSSVNLDRVKLLVDFSKDVDARHQAFYTFWIQVAQLILLNLLLPLLTGLFGYIFGTRQAKAGSTS